ncbi:hypothetical protein [Microbaculum sp. FT89]|uniref:hypothetical protein n=1 Tax=Microbaculum sp. FT89 TaxID=3447298 RepID=UPI003F531606
MGRRQNRAIGPGALALALGTAFPLAAQPIEIADTVAADARVIDIRAEDDCLATSLPGARCLPAPWLLDGGDGAPIGFHALRWLLGTVGLSGREPLVVYAGPAGTTDDALAVAALAYLAGQSLVTVHDGAAVDTGTGGESRSFSREAVYTAPMRIGSMAVSDAATPDDAGSLRGSLIEFARTGAAVAFAPQH